MIDRYSAGTISCDAAEVSPAKFRVSTVHMKFSLRSVVSGSIHTGMASEGREATTGRRKDVLCGHKIPVGLYVGSMPQWSIQN